MLENRNVTLDAGGRAARRGWTLVELLVVMSMAAGVIGLATAMLVGTFRASGHGLDQVAERGLTSRLAEQFRADVAAAKDCRPIDVGQGESGIVLQGADQRRVEYLASAQVLERIAYTGDRVDRRESYQLGESRQVRLEIGRESPTVVSCVLEQSASGPESTRPAIRQVTILATLGRDRRYQRSAPGTVAEPRSEPPAEPAANKTLEPEDP